MSPSPDGGYPVSVCSAWRIAEQFIDAPLSPLSLTSLHFLYEIIQCRCLQVLSADGAGKSFLKLSPQESGACKNRSGANQSAIVDVRMPASFSCINLARVG